MSIRAIPSFYLYGEPHRTVQADFVHVESLDYRSRPSGWTIQPHAHRELAHVFVVSEGGGTMIADGRRIAMRAPCLVLVPWQVVHGFEWNHDSKGSVITLARTLFDRLAEHDAAVTTLFAHPRAVPLAKEESTRVHGQALDLIRELGWSAPGHRTVVEATMMMIVVAALRAIGNEPVVADARPPADIALTARYRQRVEDRFRRREPIGAHARALGVSETRLRSACSRAAGCSPGTLLDQRAVLEASRMLLYSTMTVAEIGDALGFVDAAYFSRFFSRQAGCSPRTYRQQHAIG